MDRQQQFPAYDVVRNINKMQRDIKQLSLNSKGSAWYNYTLTWASSGTQPAFGNAVVISRYQRVGSTCIVRIDMTMGSTTTFGTGTYNWSLPFTAVPWSGAVGDFFLNAASTIGGKLVLGNGAATFEVYVPTSGSPHTLSLMSNTVPVTLANGHRMRLGIEYEILEGT